MEEVITVQKNSIDEWIIRGSLEGNIKSKNLVMMIHSGGHDRRENGLYPDIENGEIKRNLITGKKVLIRKKLGNYELLSQKLQELSKDICIFRMDVRNHGKSLINGQMDTRDISWERLARDMSEVIDYLINKYKFQNIHLVGSCLGALAIEYYVTGTGRNSNILMTNRNKVKSISLISPLSTLILGNNSDTNQKILRGEIKKFPRMPGIFEGKETILEARKNMDLAYEVSKLRIPTIFIASKTDRLISWDMFLDTINKMKSYNPNFKEIIIDRDLVKGFADHCFYDPNSSQACILIVSEFLISQL